MIMSQFCELQNSNHVILLVVSEERPLILYVAIHQIELCVLVWIRNFLEKVKEEDSAELLEKEEPSP